MHPGISISIYIILQAIVLLLSHIAIRKAQLPDLVYSGFKRFFIPILTILAVLPVLGTLLPDSRVKFDLQGAGNIFLAFFVYYAMGILAAFFIVGLYVLIRNVIRNAGQGRGSGSTTRQREGRKNDLRNIFRVLLLICVIQPLVVVPYGLVHAQHFRISRYEAMVDASEAAAEPEAAAESEPGTAADEEPGTGQDPTAETVDELTIVLVADLHLSVNTHYKTIERMVEAINNEQADAVLIAGDIFTSSYASLKDPDRYAALLASINSRYGTFAVCGNHDVEEGLFGGFPVTPISQAFRISEMDDFFSACHFRMLYDEIADLDGRLQIAGRVDGEKAGDGTDNRKDAAQLLRDADPDIPLLVLEHEPVEFAQLKENGADLALCGHTHAGQFFPGTITTNLFFDNTWGYKKVDGLDTYVTSGIGYYGPPIRVGCDSEIMVIKLRTVG